MFEIFSHKASFLCLDETLLISRGGVRSVYRHPTEPDKCIKIIFNTAKIRAVKREIVYLKKYRRLNKPFDHLSQFHGFCRSNLGTGAIFQLIKDYNGEVSIPLSKYVEGTIEPGLSAYTIVQLLQTLYEHLLTNNIIISDPAPPNIVVNYPEPDKPRLVLVDGIGNPHFIKLADISCYHAKKIIEKKWHYYITTNISLEEIFRRAIHPQ